MLDAVNTALGLFPKGIGPRRANILLIGESRDRGSETTLPEVVARIQHLGVTLYGLTYSAYLTPFTAKPGEYEPPRGGALDLIAVFTEPARLAQANTTKVLLSATGGRQIRFETLRKLERNLIAVGREIHTRYVLSFRAPEEAQPLFHQLDVKVKGRPELLVRARPGYWSSGE